MIGSLVNAQDTDRLKQAAINFVSKYNMDSSDHQLIQVTCKGIL